MSVTRRPGAPQDEQFEFEMPLDSPACIRIESPEEPGCNGHRVTSARVSLDGTSLLTERDFKRSFAGLTQRRHLAAGAHTVAVRVASKPGTRLDITVEVPGPAVESFSPIVADIGATIRLKGEGFVGAVTVKSGGRQLTNVIVLSENTVTAQVTDQMPVGPLTVTTPLGATTTDAPFVPLTPRGVVPFYPVNEFTADDDGSCVAPSRMRVIQDGVRVAFVLDLHRALPAQAVVRLSLDQNGEPATPEFAATLAVDSGLVAGPADTVAGSDTSQVVISATFAALDLNNPLTLGRMLVRMEATAPCGSGAVPRTATPLTMDSYADVKAVVAPGIVLARTSTPGEVASRHGLSLLATDEDAQVSSFGIPAGRSLESALVALGNDPTVDGAIPDATLYRSVDRAAPCNSSLVGSFYEPDPFPANRVGQWYLDQIGLSAPMAPGVGEGVVIAVIDTGVDPHPELAPNLLPGADVSLFGDGSSFDIDSQSGHGTEVAAVAAASVGGFGGMVGVAPHAKILPIRTQWNFPGKGGAGDGFALYRGFSKLLELNRTTPVAVANVSQAEFGDTVLITAGALALLANQALISFAAAIAGMDLKSYMHQRAREVIDAGIVLVVAAGNFGDDPWLSPFGTQYPATVNGAIVVGNVRSDGLPAADTMAARSGHYVSIAAPVTDTNGNGAVRAPAGNAGTGVAPGIDNGFICFGATSGAAPMVAGAIAHLLSPGTGIQPAAPNGPAAARLLIDTATPLGFTEKLGAGRLNLGAALLAPAASFAWSNEFWSPAGRISDFAFLPGIGDLALRGGGTTLELVTEPNATPAFVHAFATAQDWLVGVEGPNVLLLGDGSGVQAMHPDRSLTSVSAAPSFRAAVSPFLVDGNPLVAISDGNGGVRIRAANQLNADLAVIASPRVAPIISAQWSGTPSFPGRPLEPYYLSLFDGANVWNVRISSGIAECQTTPSKCPSVESTSSVGLVAGVVDWATSVGPSGPTAYFVDGTSNVFVAEPGLSASPVLVGGAVHAFYSIEANPRLDVVYVAQPGSMPFASLQGRRVLGVDFTPRSYPEYTNTPPLRIAPSGTYGYMPGALVQNVEVNHGQFVLFSRAVFIALLPDQSLP